MSKVRFSSGLQRRMVDRRRAMTFASLPGTKHQHETSSTDMTESLGADLLGQEIGLPRSLKHLAGKCLSAGEGALLEDLQIKSTMTFVSVVAEALAAPPSVRLKMERALHVTMIAGCLLARFSPTVAILIQAADLASAGCTVHTVAEVASAVSTLLSTVASPSPALLLFIRAVAASAALAAACVSVGATVDWLSHVDPQHVDVLASADKVLDLSSSCADVMDNCEELVGAAVEGWAAAQQAVATKRKRDAAATARLRMRGL